MQSFHKKLQDLIEENDKSMKELFVEMGFNNEHMYYQWKNKNQIPTLKSANNIANVFNCSLDYLFGRTEDNSLVKSQPLPKFSERLRYVLKELKVKQQRIRDDKIVSNNGLNKLVKGYSEPNMVTILKLADYLNVSIDFLVGRE